MTGGTGGTTTTGPSREEALGCAHRHGPVVAGRYRLGQVLRHGPGRCEHRARDELLRRTVTTVIAAPPTGESPQEMTLPVSARVGHGPGLAEVFDGGVENGVLYLVVPRVEGTCLADDLAAGPLPVDEVRMLGARIAAALIPIHRLGYAHGALGAELITRGPGGVTVAGLGVDEWLHRWAHHRSTPPHPAPEQRRRTPSVSPATDVYALGCLLRGAAGRLRRSDPLRGVLRRMTAADPGARPGTDEVVARLVDPGPPPPARPMAGTLTAVAAVGALALGGLVVHTAGSPVGFPGNATLGPSSTPAQVVVPSLAGRPVAGTGVPDDPPTPAHEPVAWTSAAPPPQDSSPPKRAAAPTSDAPASDAPTTSSSAHHGRSTGDPSSEPSSSEPSSSEPSSSESSSSDPSSSEPSSAGSSSGDTSGSVATRPRRGTRVPTTPESTETVVPSTTAAEASRTRSGSTSLPSGPRTDSAGARSRVEPTGADRTAPPTGAAEPTERPSHPTTNRAHHTNGTDGTDGTDGTRSGGPDERPGNA